MTASDIVDHPEEADYRPDILDPSREPLPTPGITVKLLHAERTIAVSVDKEWGIISVQEIRADPYPDE